MFKIAVNPGGSYKKITARKSTENVKTNLGKVIQNCCHRLVSVEL